MLTSKNDQSKDRNDDAKMGSLNIVRGAFPRTSPSSKKKKTRELTSRVMSRPYSIVPRHPLGARLWSVCRQSSRSEGRPCLREGPRSPEPKPRESGFQARQDRGVPKHRSRPVCLHPHATLQCRMLLGSSRGGNSS